MRLKHLLYCLLLGIGHFAYTLSFPSIINGERFIGSSYKILEPSYVHAFFLSRVKFGEFARRPVTTFLIETWERIGLPLEWAFLLVLYTGLILSFVLLFRLALKVTESSIAAYVGTALFASTFWVIHAFFAEIYAYDEPWQYVFVFAALDFMRQGKWWWFSIAFFLGLMARESTALLLPGVFFFFMLSTPLWSKANLIRTLKVGWTIPAYGLFLWLLIQGKELEEKSSSYMRDIRFKHLYYSFAEMDIGIDTLTSFFMALAVPVTILLVRRRIGPLNTGRVWVHAFALNFGINAFITFVFTMGRETRIFAQPVLMLSPFLGLYLIEVFRHLRVPFSSAFSNTASAFRLFAILSFFACICFAVSLFAYEVYWPTDTKFFSGFQHHVYLTACLCTLLFITVEMGRTQGPSKHRTWLPLVLLSLPIGYFFANQKGYRAYDLFEPVMKEVALQDSIEQREHYLLVGTTMPNVAENYFDAQEIECLAGDFNYQLPVKQFLYRSNQFEEKNISYLELQPALNFPFRYILSQYGRAENSLGSLDGMTVHTDQPRIIEPHTYVFDPDSNRFVPNEGQAVAAHTLELNEEYGQAFKAKLSYLGVDSLYSFAASVDFDCDMASEAAIVITVNEPGGQSIWEHEFLSIFLIDPDGWNRAFKAVNIPTIKDPDTEIAFYVWNPKKDEVKLRNMEITLNSQWLPQPQGPRNVLSSRQLK